MADEQEAVHQTDLGWLKTSRPSWPGHSGINLSVNHQGAVNVHRQGDEHSNQGTDNPKIIVQELGQERAHTIRASVQVIFPNRKDIVTTL
jgi:hypothetical protein